MPCFDPIPVPTTIARGVASPIAQGQEITRTETAIFNANSASLPARIHPAQVRNAITMTIGTKTAATRSATLATGALVPWAISIILAIWNRTVSSPVFSTLARRLPEPFIVAP